MSLLFGHIYTISFLLFRILSSRGCITLVVGKRDMKSQQSFQWRILDFPDRGQPQRRGPNLLFHYLAKFLPKTAWKCKNWTWAPLGSINAFVISFVRSTSYHPHHLKYIEYSDVYWGVFPPLWVMSQCLSGSGCSKDQENYDWTTAELISQLFTEVTSTEHSLYRNSVQTCRWFTKIKTLIRCTSFHCSKTDERKPLCNYYL